MRLPLLALLFLSSLGRAEDPALLPATEALVTPVAISIEPAATPQTTPSPTPVLPQPRNSDGFSSMALRAFSVPAHSLPRNNFNNTTYSYYSSSKVEIGTLAQDFAGGYGAALDFQWPLSSIFSLGVRAHGEAGVIEEDYRSTTKEYYYAPNYSPVTYTSQTNEVRRRENNAWMVRSSVRFHTSGQNWNQAWGKGGSPWGRVGRPVLELNPLLYVSTNNIVAGAEGSLQVPLASMVQLSLGYRAFDTSSFSDLSYGYYNSNYWYGSSGNRYNDFGGSGQLGLTVAIPVHGFFGPADYNANANGDGKVLVPLLGAQLERSMIIGKSDHHLETNRYTLKLPLSSWATLNALWEHQAVTNLDRSGTMLQTEWDRFGLGFKIYWAPLL